MNIDIKQFNEQQEALGAILRKMDKAKFDRYMYIRMQFDPIKYYGLNEGCDICIRLAKSILDE